MNTWLLTWNPSKWTMEREEILDDINTIKQIGFSCGRWSVGQNKSIAPGDRIFLIRLGVEPRGIVASGYALSSVYESMHWDIDKRNQNIKCRRIYIKYDKILDSDIGNILPYSILQSIAPDYHWSSQSSGISIPPFVATKLESEWLKYNL